MKWSNPGKEVAPSPTPRCSSFWKGSLYISQTMHESFKLNKHFSRYFFTKQKAITIFTDYWKFITNCPHLPKSIPLIDVKK